MRLANPSRVPAAALALALLGCSARTAPPGAGSHTTPGVNEEPATPGEDPTAAQAAPVAALLLPPPDEGPAPWLDARPPERLDALGAPGDARLGERAALLPTRAGFFAVHAERGALGPVEVPPEAVWVGLGAGDRPLYADKGGTLYRAERIEHALSGGAGFRRVGAVPGAAAWDAAGKVVAAASSWDEVFVSTDGGTSFRKAPLPEGLVADEVWARFDGIVVARARPLHDHEGARRTFVTRDRGRSFQPALLSPEALYRTGSWIWTRPDCPVVLARDGASWVARDVFELAERNLWARMIRTTSEAAHATWPARALLTVSVPGPPVPRAGEDRSGAAGCDDGARTPSHPDTPPEPMCAGLDCLGERPTGASGSHPSMLSLLSDGVCRGVGPDACAAGAPLSRLPRAVRRDRPRPLELPAACARPLRVVNAPGLPLLLCAEAGGLEAYALDPDDQWHPEALPPAVPKRAVRLGAAADGTVLVDAACVAGAPCPALVRRPLPAGADAAWYRVAVEGALAYRVHTGGRALVIALAPGAATDRPRLELRLAAPGGEVHPLATVTVPADTVDAVISTDEIHLVAGTRAAPRRYLVTEDGTLAPISP